MDERVVKFRVGVMVLACLLILGILITVFGGLPSLFRGAYTIHIQFPQTPGVSVGTPVRKAGILIGRVTNVEFGQKGGVIVTVTIHGNVQLKRNEVCRITGSILGDAIIEFVPNEAESPLIADNDFITGIVVKNPLEALGSVEGDLSQAISNVSTAGNEIGKLAAHLNDLFVNNDEQINRIIIKTEKSLDAFQQSMATINNVIGDPKMQEDLRQGLTELPALLHDTHSAVNAFQKTVGSADQNLRNLQNFTGPLGDHGPQMVGSIAETVNRLDELLGQFVTFGKALNGKDGSLSQFVNNPELYQNLNAAACNIQELTRRLRPIVEDARIFTDKIARDPGVLGVRGALQKNSGLK